MEKGNRIPVSKKRVKELLASADITQKQFCSKFLLSYEHFNRGLKKGYLSKEYAKTLCMAFDVTPDELSDSGDLNKSFEGPTILQKNNFYRGELAVKQLYQILIQSKNKEELPQRQLSIWNGLLDDLLCVVLWHMQSFNNEKEAPRLFKMLEDKYDVPLWKEYQNIGANLFPDN